MIKKLVFLSLIVLPSWLWAQQNLDPKPSVEYLLLSEVSNDTIVLGDQFGASTFSQSFGRNELMYAYIPVEVSPGDSLRILGLMTPFYGGSLQSNGLSQATVVFHIWAGVSKGQILDRPGLIQSQGITLNSGINQLRFYYTSLPELLLTNSDTLALALYYANADTVFGAQSPVFDAGPAEFEYRFIQQTQAADTLLPDTLTTAQFWEQPERVGDWVLSLLVERITGTGTSTEVISFPEKQQVAFKPYPNPANPEIAVRYEGLDPGLYQIRIFDLSGKQVGVQETQLPTRSGNFAPNISRLSTGAYIVQVSGNHIVKSFIITIVR